MVKKAWYAELLPGKYDEYKALHDNIWPDMVKMFEEAGVRNYSIWNIDNMLFGYYECDDPNLLKIVEEKYECMSEWREITAKLVRFRTQEEGGSNLTKVFDLPKLKDIQGWYFMKIMVVGGGGREHAIIKKLKENKTVEKIYALPGNGGMTKDAECVEIGAKEIDKIVEFAVENKIDYAVVAPDDPLVLGCVDALEEKGIACFGPRKNAAIIEGSKVFSKNLMKKYGIPTAQYEVFCDMDKALEYLKTAPIPTVIKADGLALGKGVIIAMTREEAVNAVKSMMEDKIFGDSGNNVVIEEFLTGPEVSVLSFTDGKTVIPMVSSMDHKRARDNDEGLNTGGMGTIAPNPVYTKKIADECMEKIFIPTIEAMNKEGRTFKGCLYFGLMLTEKGPKVIEYNCRFGDPETQVVLPLLESDLLTVMQAVTNETLSDTEVKFSGGAACCVVMASDGYPQKYDTGFEISIPDEYFDNVFVAGAKIADGKTVTAGGRVLGVTALGECLEKAISNAYEIVPHINFENAYYRKDIGAKALSLSKKEN